MAESTHPKPSDGGAAEYAPRRISRSHFLAISGVRYHLREWGPVEAPPLLLLHGARDASASFQFVVDELDDGWRVFAPDWRGHGQTAWTQGSYWLSDFLCDLDALFDELFLHAPVPVVGHSMGANIASLFAAVRPERVSRLVMLDAMGNTLDRSPVRIHEALTDLLDARREPARPRIYASLGEMAAKLISSNRRLDVARAAFLVEAIALRLPDGRFRWPHDPDFHRSFPSLHSTEEWAECWGRIHASVLCLVSTDPRPYAATSNAAVLRERAGFFRDITVRSIPDTGHNLHHDAPVIVARAIQEFLRAPATAP